MLTSLAPSPIASVVQLFFFDLTKFTSSAFYLGETLQAKTTEESSTRFINSLTSFLFFDSFKILESYSPPITIAISLENPIYLIVLINSQIYW